MQASGLRSVATPAKRLGGYVLDVLYSTLAMGVLSALVPAEGDGGGQIFLLFLGYVIVGVYFWSKGTSPGKMTLGMYVYNRATSERLGFWSMLLRETIGKWLSGFVLALGYLWILFDDDNQGWHDKLVNSVVLEG
ncbi:MAG: RDD family protein [Trueperaceae bacterium]